MAYLQQRTSSIYLLLLQLTALLPAQVAGAAGCVKELDSTWPKNPALIYDEATEDPVYPQKSGFNKGDRALTFRENTEVLLSCPGSKLTFNGKGEAKMQCSGGELTINNEPVELSNLGCKRAPKEKIIKGGACGEGGILHTIGWNITEKIFEPQIVVCFHPEQETTSYVYHKVYGKSMDAKTIDPKRPSFKSARLFKTTMTKAYSKKMQKTLFKKMFGTDEAINSKKQNYFAKGHLAPDSDFVYGYQQDATYYFINAVPQWQAFNNGNWKALEFGVRDLAIAHDKDLDVWTGAMGVLEMPDKNNNPVQILLGKSYNKEKVPAPALMWKAVYEKSTDSGVAFVGVNNPYATELTDDLRICEDICDQVSWMDWKSEDWAHGYMYCCSLDDLQKALPTLSLPEGASLLAN